MMMTTTTTTMQKDDAQIGYSITSVNHNMIQPSYTVTRTMMMRRRWCFLYVSSGEFEILCFITGINYGFVL